MLQRQQIPLQQIIRRQPLTGSLCQAPTLGAEKKERVSTECSQTRVGTQPSCVDRIPEVKDQTHTVQLGKGSFPGVKTHSSSASQVGSDPEEEREVSTAWCGG